MLVNVLDRGLTEVAQQAFATAPNIGFPLIINLPAVLVTFLVTALLVYGIKESANINTGLVFLKLGLIAVGGGSSLDCAKGVAIAATHPGPLVTYATIEGARPSCRASAGRPRRR